MLIGSPCFPLVNRGGYNSSRPPASILAARQKPEALLMITLAIPSAPGMAKSVNPLPSKSAAIHGTPRSSSASLGPVSFRRTSGLTRPEHMHSPGTHSGSMTRIEYWLLGSDCFCVPEEFSRLTPKTDPGIRSSAIEVRANILFITILLPADADGVTPPALTSIAQDLEQLVSRHCMQTRIEPPPGSSHGCKMLLRRQERLSAPKIGFCPPGVSLSALDSITRQAPI